MSNHEIGYEGKQVFMTAQEADALEIPPPDVLVNRKNVPGSGWVIVSWFLKESPALDDYYQTHPNQKRSPKRK